ncbi:hypothetical protein Rt10032_c28g6844 [Rhodotorula toruloides]|uniref:Uncharacterized protein n=1 Tax=Rhodotorula toruloides TaxID=5286 RepID=A0A511KR21_RHOTO|nr:hypothetical protein Rt10032_c28g6844 [Rhodotorula toruloides]
MLAPESVQLRIALALVLLEHQPAGVPLHEYLKALRNEVRKRRSGGQTQEESATSEDAEGSVESEEEERDEPEPAVLAEEAEMIEEVKEVQVIQDMERGPEVTPDERLGLAAAALCPSAAHAVERLLQQQTPSNPSLPSQSASDGASTTSRLFSGYIGAILDALEVRVQDEEEESTERSFQLSWEDLGTVVEWILPRVANLPEEDKPSEADGWENKGGMRTRGKKRKGGKGALADEVEERTKNELIEQLTHLLLRLATPAFDAPLALSVFASLLIRVTSSFPLPVLTRLIPFLIDQLASLLPPFMRASQIDDSALQRLSALVSLLHLAFDALLPPATLQLFLPSPPTDPQRPLRLSLERLTHLLTTTSTSLDPDNLSLRFLPAAGGGAEVTVEEAVLGVLERCWNFSELDERKEQAEAVIEAGE